MKIIAVAAAKGGVGKTSITAALAVAASRDPERPLNVAVMDLDPQDSLSEWWTKLVETSNCRAAHSGDPERLNRLIMNTHSGDHEHRLARA